MISQWIAEGETSWTGRRAEWTHEEWLEEFPANSEAPEECDHEDEWTSGGIVYKVCTVCLDDEEAGNCKKRHDAAVAFWQGVKVPD